MAQLSGKILQVSSEVHSVIVTPFVSPPRQMRQCVDVALNKRVMVDGKKLVCSLAMALETRAVTSNQ